MLPELYRIPGIDYPIASYGLVLVLAFVCAILLAVRLAGRDGIDRKQAYDLALYTIGASLIGSKLLMLVTEPWLLQPDRLMSREFWSSGGVYFGGFLGAVAGSVLLARTYRICWWRLADAFAAPIALGQAIGRLGCFAAGCCWGTPTSAWCGVQFTPAAHSNTGVPIDVHLHPVQLYESAASLLIMGLLLLIWSRRRQVGQVILSYMILYGAARFVIEFWRDDPRGNILGFTTLTGLSTSQLIGIACVLVGIAGMLGLRRRPAPSPPLHADATETT
jgi:phosphatidylglycerol:prolipoprotein diacylglycerol transferase